jgi:D-ribulokinase
MEKDFSTVYVGVDVGSASVRAALFSEKGEYLISKSKSITINNPLQDIYQQSSNEIWSSVCECVAESVQTIRDQYDKTLEIGGIGFAATCSLVVIGPNEEGLR